MAAVNFLLQHLVLLAVGVLVGVAFLLGGILLARKATGLAFRHLPMIRRFALAGLAAALWLYGSVKPDGDGGTNAPPLTALAPILSGGAGAPFVPSCAFDLAEPFAPPPPGAVTNRLWLLRGGFDDAFAVPFPGDGFPWRDGVATGLVVFASGEMRPAVDVPYFPKPFPDGLSLPPRAAAPSPDAGIFWHAATPSNSLVVTWSGAWRGRDPARPVDLQAEFFADGSFVYRYADQTRRHPPALPFDWDGDGLANELDPDPCAAGPDAHGANAEWYGRVYGDVLAAADGTNGVELVWLDAARSNACYFVDVVTTNGPAPIYFSDRRGRLADDPVVVALPGVPCRVPLVIGPEYAVTSTVPFELSVPADAPGRIPEPDDVRLDRESDRSLIVCWPIRFSYEDADGTGTDFAISARPSGLPLTYHWHALRRGAPTMLLRGLLGAGSGCDCFSSEGSNVVVTCSGSCDCGGCSLGGYGYVLGHSVALPTISCGCPDYDEPPEPRGDASYYSPSMSLSLGSAAVIYEDAYVGTPGVTTPRRSTRTTVFYSIRGGTSGGSFVISCSGLGRLLPVEGGPLVVPAGGVLGPGESQDGFFVCEGGSPSGREGDVSMRGRITDLATGDVQLVGESKLTVFKVELRATVDPPDPDCRQINRHRYGVNELVEIRQTPNYPFLSTSSGGGIETAGGTRYYRCPLDGCHNPLSICIAGSVYTPILDIVEPQGVLAYLKEGLTRGSTMTFGLSDGMSGGIGMLLELYVTPMNVSFTQIAIQEAVSFTYEPEGYFCNLYFNGVFSHSAWEGAGIWNDVRNDHYFMLDQAAYRYAVPWLLPNGRVTDDETYSWRQGYVKTDNPFGWNVKEAESGAFPYKRFGEDIQDEFSLSENGTFSIRKLGKTVSRETNGVIRINGVIVE